MNVGEFRAALEGLAHDIPVTLNDSVMGEYWHLRVVGLTRTYGDRASDGDITILVLDIEDKEP